MGEVPAVIDLRDVDTRPGALELLLARYDLAADGDDDRYRLTVRAS